MNKLEKKKARDEEMLDKLDIKWREREREGGGEGIEMMMKNVQFPVIESEIGKNDNLFIHFLGYQLNLPENISFLFLQIKLQTISAHAIQAPT